MFKNLKYDENGLVPVVTQSYFTGKVLMQAYANEIALNKTLESGYAVYYSRSRRELWLKGETSGNKQKIVEVKSDCDQDSILYVVKEEGVACHTGEYSCFHNSIISKSGNKPLAFEVISELYEKINCRRQDGTEVSYVAKLFKKGSDKIIQKVGEEAVETVIALKNANREEIIYEASDLIFHLLVALVDRGIKLSDIEEELLNRYK